MKRARRGGTAGSSKVREPGPLVSEPAAPSKRAAGTGAAANVEAEVLIVKVKTPDYVPGGITVRARISPTIFTAIVPRAARAGLEADPQVIALAGAEPVVPARKPR